MLFNITHPFDTFFDFILIYNFNTLDVREECVIYEAFLATNCDNTRILTGRGT